MRFPMLTTTLLVLLPAAALARDKLDCTLKAEKGDVVSKGKDLEVKAGQTVKDAVVVEGNLVLRKGSSVKSAVVLRGSLTIEDGATVRDSVVVVGGKASIPAGAVKGSQIILDDALHLVGEDGKSVEVSVSVGGEALGTKMVAALLKDVHACQVVQ